MSTLLELRDEALDASKGAHDRIRHELAIYRNNAYGSGSHRVGRVKSQAGESLDPKVRKGVNRLIPGFLEQMARIEVQPDRSYRTDDDILLCEDLQNWLDMNDDAVDEGEDMEALIKQNLALGHAVCKVGWDPQQMLVTAGPVNPLSLSVDPSCRKVNFSDAEWLVHREQQTIEYVKRFYPDFDLGHIKLERKDTQLVSVDEMWIRPQKAVACGVECDLDLGGMLVAVFINSVFHKVEHSPYWYPDFPFCSWRNFTDIDDQSGKPHEFWGYGYGTQLWSNQKLIDEMLANLVLISRNQAVGRFLSTKGALDMEQVLPIHGLNIEVNEDFSLNDIEHLAPDQIPPILFQIYEYLSSQADSEIPSLSDVFVGEEPRGNASGRAINARQYASFSQLSSNIRSMNDFRRKRNRVKITMIQQFAQRPLLPHQWRGGIDLPEFFPEDARHVSYQLVLPDTSMLPNTPAGRLQVVQMMANMGMMMAPERMLEFIGLDRGFGLKAEDFKPMPMPVQGAGGGAPGQLDEGVVSGIEAAMKAER